VPGLVDRAGEGDVEPELHDLVVRPEDRLADGPHPRVPGQVDETAHLLRMDLHVVAVRPPADGSARPGDRLLERRLDVLPHPVRPGHREGIPVNGDARLPEFAETAGEGLRYVRQAFLNRHP
jgi:hypothetical protein